MKKEIKILTLVSLLVLMLLFLPGGFSGALSTVAYILAFVLPFAIGFSFLKANGASGEKLEYLSVKKDKFVFFLPALFPSVLAVIGLSALTSVIMKVAFGAENTVELGDSILMALILHAALPAVLEEGVFRYLPLRLIGRRAPLLCIGASAYFFALVHHSFFAFAYAALAGALFMLIDLMCESVIPSLVIHFVNNSLSVLWVFYSDNSAFAIIYFVSLSLLAVLSLVFIAVWRKKYRQRLSAVLSGTEKYTPSPEPLLMLAASLVIAVAELA